MTRHRTPAACIGLMLAGGLASCSVPGAADRTDGLEGVDLAVHPVTVMAPSGDRSVLYGGTLDPQLTYSAGFMQRVGLGEVQTGSSLAWAPDSRNFIVSGSSPSAWSELRLWRVGVRQTVQENLGVRQAAIAELASRNRCIRPGRGEYSTRALAWGGGGRSLYVLTQWHRQVACPDYVRQQAVVSRIEVRTGKVDRTLTVEEARQAWSGLPLPSSRPEA